MVILHTTGSSTPSIATARAVPIHVLVVLPIFGAEGGASVSDMAERPEAFV